MTLKLYLMGLVAFVVGERGELQLVMPRDPHHLPVLVWDSTVTSKDPAADQGKKIKDVLNLSTQPHGVILDGHTITIEGMREGNLSPWPLPQHPWYASIFGHRPTNRHDGTGALWIPKLESILGEGARLRPDLGTCNSAAQLDMTGKEVGLSTYGLASYGRKVHSMTWKIAGENWKLWDERGAIADTALLTIPIEVKDTLVIRLLLDGQEKVKLELVPRHGQSEVDLLLGNLYPIKIDKSDLLESERAEHFHAYFGLTVAGDSKKRPVPEIGFKRISDGKVEPEFRELPEVIRSVSAAECPEYTNAATEYILGGVCRPICGFAILKSPV